MNANDIIFFIAGFATGFAATFLFMLWLDNRRFARSIAEAQPEPTELDQ